jgi:hypothetical protein
LSRSLKPLTAIRPVRILWLSSALFRARRKARDALPAAITELQKTGATLLKAAKGMGW